MAEYISDQTESTTAAAGAFFVFDEGSNTWKISRQNLIGQMDINTVNVATNTSNISANTGNISTNTSNITNNSSVIDAIAKDTIMRGLRFNGSNQYLNIGQVPMLNSADSYVILKYKASNWENVKWPFGYFNTGADAFGMYRNGVNEERYQLLTTPNIVVTPTEYPNPNSYQEFRVNVENWNGGINPTLTVSIGGNRILGMSGVVFSPVSTSSIDFFIGCYNLQGGGANFTELEFFSFESFNGTTKKEVNFKNNWDGATLVNNPSPIYSIDGGTTWLG